jgi:hypothetical protein
VENREVDVVEGLAPSKMEKEPTSSVSVGRAGYVEAPPTLGNIAPTGWKTEEKLWIMVIHLYLLGSNGSG